MLKYLLPEQLRTHLSLGKLVEQWLSPRNEDDNLVLRHISISKDKNGEYALMYMENFDDGNENCFDIYDFSYIDPDEPAVIHSFDSIADVLEFAQTTYEASLDKYGADGMLQDEYANYLKDK